MNRVFLLDDDPAFLSLLSNLLKRQGHTVFTAETAEQAMKMLDSLDVDKAVLDLNLEGVSSLPVLKALMQHQPQCHAIMLTGYASIATTVEAMKLGAKDYLCKPASLDAILQALSLSTEEASAKPTGEENYSPMSPKRMEWEHIQRVLQENDGNISATARVLNMHRRTLQRKLQKKPTHF